MTFGKDGAAAGEQPTATTKMKTVTSSHREVRTFIRVSLLSPTGGAMVKGGTTTEHAICYLEVGQRIRRNE